MSGLTISHHDALSPTFGTCQLVVLVTRAPFKSQLGYLGSIFVQLPPHHPREYFPLSWSLVTGSSSVRFYPIRSHFQHSISNLVTAVTGKSSAPLPPIPIDLLGSSHSAASRLCLPLWHSCTCGTHVGSSLSISGYAINLDSVNPPPMATEVGTFSSTWRTYCSSHP